MKYTLAINYFHHDFNLLSEKVRHWFENSYAVLSPRCATLSV